jgi:predicted nucleic acid-binding protein
VLSIFWDASALVKRYTAEPGAALVREAFRLVPLSRMACSQLGILEVVSVLVRHRNDGWLNQELFEQSMTEFRSEVIDNSGIRVVAVGSQFLLPSVQAIERHNLNATDAIVLVSALELGRNLRVTGQEQVLWTADQRLRRAAQAEGLRCFDPESETLNNVRQMMGGTS